MPGFIETVRADELRAGDVFSTDGYTVTWACLLSGGGPADEVSVVASKAGHEKAAYLAPDFPCHLWRETDGAGVQDETLAHEALVDMGVLADEPARWVLVENTPGYMPDDDDPATFARLADARDALREAVAEYVESLYEREGWREGFEPTIDVSEGRCFAYVGDPGKTYDLGRVFELHAIEGAS